MAAKITTSSSTQAKTNINTTISTSSFTASSAGSKIQNVSLTEIQNAVKKLTTYAQKVNNCGNCKNYTIQSTSCQSDLVTTYCQTPNQCKNCVQCFHCSGSQCSYYNYSVYSDCCSSV